jgi:hypothetical protein
MRGRLIDKEEKMKISGQRIGDEEEGQSEERKLREKQE